MSILKHKGEGLNIIWERNAKHDQIEAEINNIQEQIDKLKKELKNE